MFTVYQLVISGVPGSVLPVVLDTCDNHTRAIQAAKKLDDMCKVLKLSWGVRVDPLVIKQAADPVEGDNI